MFPTATSEIFFNEEGEVLGWDAASDAAEFEREMEDEGWGEGWGPSDGWGEAVDLLCGICNTVHYIELGECNPATCKHEDSSGFEGAATWRCDNCLATIPAPVW